jgi:hypothetical protein
VSPLRYELGFYIQEDGIIHSHRRENLTSYNVSVSRLPCLERRRENKHFRIVRSGGLRQIPRNFHFLNLCQPLNLGTCCWVSLAARGDDLTNVSV